MVGNMDPQVSMDLVFESAEYGDRSALDITTNNSKVSIASTISIIASKI